MSALRIRASWTSSGAGVGEPVRVTSFAEFQRLFGGLDRSSEASYGLLQYFLNGGQTAWVMRLATATAKAATVGLPGDNTYRPGTAWVVDATNPGVWGNNIHVTVQHPSDDPGRSSFNLVVTETVNKRDVNQETYFNLSMSTTSPQYAKSVVNNRSALIQLKDQGWPSQGGYLSAQRRERRRCAERTRRAACVVETPH